MPEVYGNLVILVILVMEEVPNACSIFGMVLIVSRSLFIFVREAVRKKPLALKTSLRAEFYSRRLSNEARPKLFSLHYKKDGIDGHSPGHLSAK